MLIWLIIIAFALWLLEVLLKTLGRSIAVGRGRANCRFCGSRLKHFPGSSFKMATICSRCGRDQTWS